MPSIAASGLSLLFISPYFLPERTSGRKMLSLRLNVSSRLKSWNTNPRLLRLNADSSFSLIAVMSLPLSSTWPRVGLSSAASILSSVVLPEPDSPMMAMYSPFSTERFTFLRAVTLLPPNRVVYTFCRPFTSSKTVIFMPP